VSFKDTCSPGACKHCFLGLLSATLYHRGALGFLSRDTMGDNTEISWTDSTFNPWIGCTNVSPGCDNCYAEALANRYRWAKWGNHNRKRTSSENWKKPVRWNGDGPQFKRDHGHRHRVFCASLADVFDNQVKPSWRRDPFALIRDCHDLDWQLLTKRPQNILKMLPADWGSGYPNVWLGTTTEDEKRYRQRWSILARIPATIRFISYEPAVGALGRIDLGVGCVPDWIIVGGESGPKARAMDPQWARSVRDQCQALGIAFFHKQWGTYRSNPAVWSGAPEADARALDPPSNGKGGARLDGRLYRQFPEAKAVTQRAIA
jgi:protein gp37